MSNNIKEESFSERLYGLLDAQMNTDIKNSILFRYKRKELEETYTGKKPNEYVKLSNAFKDIKDNDSAEEYLRLVISLLANNTKLHPKKSDNLEREFQDQFNMFLYKDHQLNEKTFSKVTEALSEFNDSGIEINVDWNNKDSKEVITKLHEQLLVNYIVRQLDSDRSNSKNGKKTIDSALLDMCAKDPGMKQVLFAGKDVDEAADREEKINIFKCITEAGKKPETKESKEYEEYRSLFVPLYIDAVTGVTMCIIGRDHYEMYYKTMREGEDPKHYLEKFDNCQSPCALTVLRFTDVLSHMGDHFCASVAYATWREFTRYMEGNRDDEYYRRYFEKVYDEYKDAILAARKDFGEINVLTSTPKTIVDSSIYNKYFIRKKIEKKAKSPENKETSKARKDLYGEEYDKKRGMKT